ncbi:FRG domain-containing protein [Pseudomonas sp. NY15367]
MSKGITSTEGLIRKIFSLTQSDEELLFYRGHSDKDKYKLEPSLYRKENYIKNEAIMFRELLISNPVDFSGDSSTLDKLVRMQHHSLPTRLLDISSNPLMALYFACKSKPEKTGQVVVVRIKKKDLKFFDSDTASCISNISRLPKEDKDKLKLSLSQGEFNQSEEAQRLIHLIKEEKPYFLDRIIPSDLEAIICVKGKMNNNRILSQAGAFLLFGKGAVLPEEGNDSIGIERVDINKTAKQKILQELDSLNINESTAFPYIENSAKYIAAKYGA